MQKVNCFSCESQLFVHDYQTLRTKRFFCSFKCRKYKKLGSSKEPKKCVQCQSNFVRLRSGRDVNFCSSKCYGLSVRKPYILKKGYKRVLKPEHSRADSKGYVREHILIAEEKYGRPISVTEVVHHLDGNKLNNSKDNLELLPNQSAHMKFHKNR